MVSETSRAVSIYTSQQITEADDQAEQEAMPGCAHDAVRKDATASLVPGRCVTAP